MSKQMPILIGDWGTVYARVVIDSALPARATTNWPRRNPGHHYQMPTIRFRDLAVIQHAIRDLEAIAKAATFLRAYEGDGEKTPVIYAGHFLGTLSLNGNRVLASDSRDVPVGIYATRELATAALIDHRQGE